MTQPLPGRNVPNVEPTRPGGAPRPGRPTTGGRPGPVYPGMPNPAEPPLDEEDTNAYNVLVSMLRGWGLETLAPEVLRLLQEGYAQEQVPILLQDTEAYKKRFAGNEIRRQKGLAVLSPAEYLAVESGYRQVMSAAGLPSGYWDQHDDFASWIGNDVSPVEVNGRVQAAADTVYRMDDATKATLRDWYGIQPGDLVGYLLDPERGYAQVQAAYRGTRIGGAAASAGLQITRERGEQLGHMTAGANLDELSGLTRQYVDRATQGAKLGAIYGVDYGEEEAAGETFGSDVGATQKRKALAKREKAEFSGSGGVTSGSLGKSGGSY